MGTNLKQKVKKLNKYWFSKTSSKDEKKNIAFDIIILFILPVLFFAPAFFQHKYLSAADFLFGWAPWIAERPAGYDGPSNYILSDQVDSFVPIAQEIKSKSFIELIDGYMNMANWGRPNPSVIGSGAGHEPFFIVFIKIFNSVGLGMFVHFLFKLMLAGIGMYFLMRNFKTRRAVRMFAAVSYMFATPFLAATYGFHTLTFVLLPLLFLSILFLKHKFRIRNMVLFLSIGSLIVLSGFPLLILYSFLFAGLYFVFLILLDKEVNWKKKMLNTGKFILLNLSILLFLSFSLLPNILNYSELDLSYREGFGNRGLTYEHSLQLIYPNYCGNHINLKWTCDNNWNETSMYAGLLPIIFILLALFVKSDKLKHKWFMLGIFLFEFILIFNLFDINSIISKIPILSNNSGTRLTMFIPFFLIVAGTLSFQELLESNKNWGKKVFSAILVIGFGILVILTKYQLLLKSIYEKLSLISFEQFKGDLFIFVLTITLLSFFLLTVVLSKKYKWLTPIIFLIFIIPFIELYHYNNPYLPYVDRDYFFRTTQSIKFLEENTTDFDRILPIERVFLPSTPMYYDINSFTGHDFRTKAFTDIAQAIDPTVFAGHGTLGYLNRRSTEIDSNMIKLLKFNRIKYLVQDPNALSFRYDLVEYQPHSNAFLNPTKPLTYEIKLERNETLQILKLRAACQTTCDLEKQLNVIKNPKIIRSNGTVTPATIIDEKLDSKYLIITFDKLGLHPEDKIQFTLLPTDKIKYAITNYYEIFPNGSFTKDSNLGFTDLALTMYSDNEKNLLQEQKNNDLLIEKVSDNDTTAYFYTCEDMDKDTCINTLTDFTLKKDNLGNTNLDEFARLFDKLTPISITKYDAGKISFDTSNISGPGVIIISENYFSGWRSDNNTEVFKGLLGTLDTYYSADTNATEVNLTFLNPYLVPGIGITLVWIIGFGGICLLVYYREKKNELT